MYRLNTVWLIRYAALQKVWGWPSFQSAHRFSSPQLWLLIVLLITPFRFLPSDLFPNIFPSGDNFKRLSLLNTCPNHALFCLEIVYIIQQSSTISCRTRRCSCHPMLLDCFQVHISKTSNIFTSLFTQTVRNMWVYLWIGDSSESVRQQQDNTHQLIKDLRTDRSRSWQDGREMKRELLSVVVDMVQVRDL